MSKQIVLFDMDGTLTEPRQKFDPETLEQSLYVLTNRGVDIGIVTGSGFKYLREQMGDWIDNSDSRYNTHLFPCNGTQYYKPPTRKTEDHKLVHSVSMLEEIGPDKYRELVSKLVKMQFEVSNFPISLSGHFIDYRGSMINWCPIGRDASSKQRSQFVELDSQLNFRALQLVNLRDNIEQIGLQNLVNVKLGGDTSFDIYPTGWDKTYALNHLSGYNVWFVGDRCEVNGNDYELYSYCSDQGFKSTGPKDTKKIIADILKNIGAHYV